MGVVARATDLEGGEEGSAFRVLLASLGLHTVSFFLPAFGVPQQGTVRGGAAFLMALLGPAIYSVGGILTLVRESDPRGLLVLLSVLPWSANPAYWLAAHRLHIGRRRGVVMVSVFAVLLGLSAWAMPTAFWLSFPADRRGPPPYVYREGYWLWLGSMALLVYGGWEGGGSRRGRAEAVEMAQSCDD
jgi:hypothetical protein